MGAEVADVMSVKQENAIEIWLFLRLKLMKKEQFERTLGSGRWYLRGQKAGIMSAKEEENATTI